LQQWVVVGLVVMGSWVVGTTSAFAQTLLPTIFDIPVPGHVMRDTVTDTVADTVTETMAGEVNRVVEAAPKAPAFYDVVGIPAIRKAEVQATELRGLLPHQNDRHYFGLEAIQPGGAFAVTLVVEPAAALEAESVNFVVLTQAGLQQFLAGADPLAVKIAGGSPLLFDQVGNRLTALVPGSHDTGYTVIVYNNGHAPIAYTLQVEGGVLRDDAGQTYSAVTVDRAGAQGPASVTPKRSSVAQLVAREGMMRRLSLLPDVPLAPPELLSLPLGEPVKARRVSGIMTGSQDRHYFELAAERGSSDIVLTLHYSDPTVTPDQLNFWVMTQDGVRHLIQGALPQELNLAVGRAIAPGVYQARLRMAQGVLYTVVLYNDGNPTEYALTVEGGILVDRYGQSREAQVAALEILALAGK
jgi:hypothetical protein